ncbi:MAG: HEAT repeat domain-containing protein [Chloroflexi bacterium]|nr:HEAT repeat domain-containing protein [Chloroflexota bacterium]MBU1750116.1 HEAT repeat domain-containing protein [Chloroflexota bacterium]MBU1879758.1 HEAT repeat domain-containing protein [Chloroflexota bacterium]
MSERRSYEELAARLRDLQAHWVVRGRAAEELVQGDDQVRALELLIEALRWEPDGGARSMIVATLGRFRDARALMALAYALEHDADQEVRAEAAQALGDMGDTGAMDALIAALDDTHAIVRARAVVALVKLDDPRAHSPVQTLTEDPNDEVRIQARLALRRWGLQHD